MGQLVRMVDFKRRRAMQTMQSSPETELREIEKLEARIEEIYASIPGMGHYLEREKAVLRINVLHEESYRRRQKLTTEIQGK